MDRTYLEAMFSGVAWVFLLGCGVKWKMAGPDSPGEGCKKGKEWMVLKIDNAPRSNLQSAGIERLWIVNRKS